MLKYLVEVWGWNKYLKMSPVLDVLSAEQMYQLK